MNIHLHLITTGIVFADYERKTCLKTSATTCPNTNTTASEAGGRPCFQHLKTSTTRRTPRSLFGVIRSQSADSTRQRRNTGAKLCQRRKNNSGNQNCRHGYAHTADPNAEKIGGHEQRQKASHPKTDLRIAAIGETEESIGSNQGKLWKTADPQTIGERHI